MSSYTLQSPSEQNKKEKSDRMTQCIHNVGKWSIHEEPVVPASDALVRLWMTASISSAKSTEASSYAQAFGELAFSNSSTTKAVPARRSACLRPARQDYAQAGATSRRRGLLRRRIKDCLRGKNKNVACLRRRQQKWMAKRVMPL